MKNVAVLTEDGAFTVFFRPLPREYAIQGKKNARGSARGGGGAGKGAGGAGGIDWCITLNYKHREIDFVVTLGAEAEHFITMNFVCKLVF